MQVFLVFIPLSILLIGLSIWVFSWAVKSGQFDDLEGPAHSILYDDDLEKAPKSQKKSRNGAPQQNIKNTSKPTMIDKQPPNS